MIDGRAVHRYRRERGLTHNDLASHSGIGISRLRLMLAGTQRDVATLGDLRRLADALRVDPVSLLCADESQAARSTPDDVKLEQALAVAGKRVRSKYICGAFGWKLTRLQPAVESLQARLEGSGMRVDVNPSGLLLEPRLDRVTSEELECLTRATFPKQGMKAKSFQVLRMLAENAVTTPALERSTTHGRDLVELEQLGYVTGSADGAVRLSDDALNSLAAAGLSPKPFAKPTRSVAKARRRYIDG